eukprot:jgi/Botrbrau1/19079/Bobra.0686s0001.1
MARLWYHILKKGWHSCIDYTVKLHSGAELSGHEEISVLDRPPKKQPFAINTAAWNEVPSSCIPQIVIATVRGKMDSGGRRRK